MQNQAKEGKEKPSLNLGDEVKDLITGYKGVAVAEVRWLNGQLRIVVQGPLNKDAEVPHAESFDIENLEVTRAGAFSSTERYNIGASSNVRGAEFNRTPALAGKPT